MLLLGCCLGNFPATAVKAATTENKNKMEWWRDAKFGMFIHWGIYSVPAGKWDNKSDYAEWIMWQASLSKSTYGNFANQFNPTSFNADEWVKLAKDAGQKYIVITSKHHDGFAMFHSKVSPYNVVDATPFKRDVIAEMAAACRKYGMKLGLYYSQAQDWYQPGGAHYSGKIWDNGQKGKMEDYIRNIAVPQVKEILSNYGDVAELWWDTPVDMTPELAKLLDDVVKEYPNMITNNRLGGGYHGDLETPEQYIPATGIKGKNWEVCMTINKHWGYCAADENWKSTHELLQKLVDIVSKGGNFLLNVGPDSHGIIPVVCQNTLREMGTWLSKNGEAIYGTTASPFPHLPWGRATRKGDMIYLHVFDWVDNGKLLLPLSNRIKRAYLLADRKTPLKISNSPRGWLINLPAYAPDANVSVIAVEIAGEPDVKPAPSANKLVKESDTNGDKDMKTLTDGDLKTTWKAPQGAHEAELYLDLGHEESVSAMALDEIWSQWSGISQDYELQCLKGGKWSSVTRGKTKGAGISVDFEPVKAKMFRLILKNTKEEPALKEWTLYN